MARVANARERGQALSTDPSTDGEFNEPNRR